MNARGSTDRPRASRVRGGVATAATLLPLLVAWVVLVAPDDPTDQPLTWLLRVPVEPLLLGLLLLVLPGRWRRRAGLVLGAVVGVATLVKLLDIGFTASLRRPFDLLADWTYLGSARDLLADSVGASWATAALVGAAVLVAGLLAVVPWSLRDVTRRLEPVVDHHRRGWSRALALASTVWVAAAVTQVGPGTRPAARVHLRDRSRRRPRGAGARFAAGIVRSSPGRSRPTPSRPLPRPTC